MVVEDIYTSYWGTARVNLKPVNLTSYRGHGHSHENIGRVSLHPKQTTSYSGKGNKCNYLLPPSIRIRYSQRALGAAGSVNKTVG